MQCALYVIHSMLQSMNTVVSNVHNIISSMTVKFVVLYMKDAVGCIKVT